MGARAWPGTQGDCAEDGDYGDYQGALRCASLMSNRNVQLDDAMQLPRLNMTLAARRSRALSCQGLACLGTSRLAPCPHPSQHRALVPWAGGCQQAAASHTSARALVK